MIKSKTNSKDIKIINNKDFFESDPSPLQQLYKGSQVKENSGWQELLHEKLSVGARVTTLKPI